MTNYYNNNSIFHRSLQESYSPKMKLNSMDQTKRLHLPTTVKLLPPKPHQPGQEHKVIGDIDKIHPIQPHPPHLQDLAADGRDRSIVEK